MPTLKIQPVLTRTEDNNSVRTIPVPDMIFDWKEGEEQNAIINDDTITVPRVVDLSESTAITCIIMWAVYTENDPPNNIVAGAVAPFLVEKDNSGIWERIDKIMIHGGPLTQLKYKKANTVADGRKITVKRIICATGV